MCLLEKLNASIERISEGCRASFWLLNFVRSFEVATDFEHWYLQHFSLVAASISSRR